MIVVDTNVILDVLTKHAEWGAKSELALRGLTTGEGIVGPIVYAELAVGYEDSAQLDADIKKMGLAYEGIDQRGLFVAGQAYADYRKRGGPRQSILPDFLIGAQAQVLGCRILTRDLRRFRTAFPDIQLVEP
jgi:hypothetical protein